jgi:thioredoxin 1
VGWADLFEKEELAARLAGLVAQSALFSRSGALTPGQVGAVTDEQLRVEMADERTPLIVDVFATWCGPCKLIAPMLSSLAGKFGPKLRVAKMDSDAHAELSSELRVSGLPTLLFLREGKEVHRIEGVPGNAAALEALACQYLGL